MKNGMLSDEASKIVLGDNGFFRLRYGGTGTTYIDIFESNGNGIILGLSDGIFRGFLQVNGVQTKMFEIS